MEHLTDPEQFVGLRGAVDPRDDDPFTYEFEGMCIGTRYGFLQVRDADDDVFDIEISQFTPSALSAVPSAGEPNRNIGGAMNENKYKISRGMLKCPHCSNPIDADNWIMDALASPINIVCSECSGRFSVEARPKEIEWIIVPKSNQFADVPFDTSGQASSAVEISDRPDRYPMNENDLCYGTEYWEYLELDPDDALDRVLDDACDGPGEKSFDDIKDRIDWPVKINVYKRMEPGDAEVGLIAEISLDSSLEYLDADYAGPDGDYTEPTEAMRAAALEFARTVVREYVSWACEKTGEVIEYSREYARKRF